MRMETFNQWPPYGAKYLRALSRYNQARRYFADYVLETRTFRRLLFVVNSNILGPVAKI